MKRISHLASVLFAAVAALGSPFASAYTDKPVKMIVPAPAGGTIDVMARIVGDQLARDIGQPVVVENKPGAGGAIAVKYLLSQPADGQTLMMTASNVLTEVPHVLKGGFDPLKDVKPLSLMARSSLLFISAPQFPAKDAKEAIAYVKAHPGQVSYASYSAGTASQYAGAILNKAAGLDMQHVPYPGSAPALAQVMGGQIPLMFDGAVTSKNLIAAGKVRLLAVATKARMPEFPNVPTLAELGYPELNFGNWTGVIASSQMPAPLAEKIHAALQKVAANASVRERMVGAGFEPVPERSLAQAQAELRQEYDRNAEIVKTFNIKLD
ncbi:tripartite tricarboxylate transporter substrate binding protein [Variovorax soli]|uniref:Tripartite-type tricarboxylate transporter receptor subunit TctC n=1 Tax=Variovorax soli TaxID=376815 RepID=A0ABU1NH80_9BURK|nr:tripartite tricarboxylate transporter substrate binding protein [Variovorax soli]MDR6537800.1 tripartite-type tricarboxylate transporter receptor subunit TctC [Variovorax soli]